MQKITNLTPVRTVAKDCFNFSWSVRYLWSVKVTFLEKWSVQYEKVSIFKVQD